MRPQPSGIPAPPPPPPETPPTAPEAPPTEEAAAAAAAPPGGSAPAAHRVRISTVGVELLHATHPCHASEEVARQAQQPGRGKGRGPWISEGLLKEALQATGVVPQDAPQGSILTVDCRGFNDPERHHGPRPNHLGVHPHNLYGLAGHRNFGSFFLGLRRGFELALASAPVVHVCFYCKKGRHRSVGMAKLFAHVLQETSEVRVDGVDHLSSPFWHRQTCDYCEECRTRTNYSDAAEAAAVLFWRQQA